MTHTPDAHPCLNCGACCAAFRVSFYWAEASMRSLPDAMTEKVNDWHLCMAGSWARQPRCVALEGEVGKATRCSVYDARPSPCREVQPGDSQCTAARNKHQLPPLILSQVARSIFQPLAEAVRSNE
ncbi:YkgJ family cysteine cluster protein [Chitinimonas sp. BJB300]|nr:YkgJ family cysteine cluster protein [Chitinimonas sp. BJB300]PHV11707.1 zinc/iron-chelating domain-containing protein [Chitinimonas sp. BJB300]TSJ88598.1 YkgJ family cysteine cluster protein [Chitinimonas sp. BJB300]